MSPLESARICLEEGMKSNNLLQDQITDSQKDRLQFLPQINNVNKGSLTYFADIITWTKIASSVAENMNSSTGCPFL